jgi:N-acetylglutamate synthase
VAGPTLDPADVGSLVTLRTVTRAGAADIVGTLVALSPTELQLRRRDGRVVTLDVSNVTHARRVPPSPSQRIDPAGLHRVMADGWRALEVERLGEWLLRASGGFTRRGNSALPLGPSGLPIRDALSQVERWYAARGLPVRMQVPATPAMGPLVDALTAAGLTPDSDVHVMTAEIGPVLHLPAPVDVIVQLDSAPDDAWVASYRRHSGPLPLAARELLTNHPAAVFASVRAGDDCVAIARAAVDGRWAGLYAVEVVESHRRRGLARAASMAALRWAAQQGARRAYLQTEIGNSASVALYRSLTFDLHHDYRHWVRQ